MLGIGGHGHGKRLAYWIIVGIFDLVAAYVFAWDMILTLWHD
jgi:hypothetical protein